MVRPILVVLTLASSAPLVSAQTAPAAHAQTVESEAIAAALKSVRGLAPRDAEAKLRARAASDNAAALLVQALAEPAARAALEAKLAPSDPSGALAQDFRILAKSLDAARRGEAQAAAIGAKPFGPLPPEPGEGNEDGLEQRAEVFAGATGVPGRRLPAAGVEYEGEYNKGPWRAELGARGLLAPTGSAGVSDGTLEATASRRLGSSPFRLFAGGELHRDDLMGLDRHFSARAGVEAQILATKRQELKASFGAGAATERHLNGESERHPLTLTSVEYALKLSARAAFNQGFELESNPRSGRDYEFKSVTAFVYDVSEHVSVRLARMFVKRGEPVEGYAGRRTETTLGLVLH